jgi:flavin-dependent dehydrogenase
VTDVDVVVLGAGPAGSETARRLATAGCEVLLIERSSYDRPRIGESLAPTVESMLRGAGLWERFEALLALPSYGTRSIWGSPTPQMHSHLWSVPGQGWHVDRVAFDRMLALAAAEAGTDLRCGASIESCEHNETGWSLRMSPPTERSEALREEHIQARIVVDATGRGAHLSRSVGAQRIVFDRLVGIVCLFTDQSSTENGYILIEAAAEGWWYSAPVPGGKILAAFMTDGDLARTAKLADEIVWLSAMASTFSTRDRISGKRLWGPRVFSAMSQCQRRTERSVPWIAVGDAGLAVDPVSGSGVVRALRSAENGADAVLRFLDTDANEALDDFEHQRHAECNVYLQERAMYYGLEQRWPGSVFWNRRNQSSARADAATGAGWPG